MIIKKSELNALLDRLAGQCQVFAPVKKGLDFYFAPIRSGAEADFSYGNSVIPPKEVLFPPTEALFTYAVGDAAADLQECLDTGKKVIFGLRPCDAQSFLLLDKVFCGDQYRDPYYLTRRDNTVLVGLGCNEPRTTCFCTSLNGGPFGTAGLDLLLVDTGDQYVVEAVSAKGKDFAAGLNLPPAGGDDRAAAAKVKEAAVISCTINLAGLKEKMDGNYNDPVWDLVYERCLGCGACTYSCPTCHCFDIVDEAKDAAGCRIRNWDACMFGLFTLHGSGHNPRPTQKERFRQRFMHKFKYFVDNFAAVACVGCGRCIVSCPVNIDIRQVLADIQGAGGDGK